MKREKYQEKKAKGLCVYSTRCPLAAVDSPYCPEHRKKSNADGALRAKTRYKVRRRENQRKRRADRIAAGLCVNCNQPLCTETVCRRCADEIMANWHAKHPGPPKRITKCSVCGQPGHYAPRCKNRPVDPVRLEDYALARIPE